MIIKKILTNPKVVGAVTRCATAAAIAVFNEIIIMVSKKPVRLTSND